MAQDLATSKTRRFATSGMLPVGKEEMNYIWGRKLAQNSLAALPTPVDWGTIYLEETGSAVFGSYQLTFDREVWPNFPCIELWMVRGGTEIINADFAYKHKNTAAGDRCVGIEVDYGVLGVNDGTIFIRYYPDIGRKTDTTEVNFTGNRLWFGTFLYRLF